MCCAAATTGVHFSTSVFASLRIRSALTGAGCGCGSGCGSESESVYSPLRFGLVLITYATKLCQLMERGTAAGAAAFAFNRICCADYRYEDIVLALIGAAAAAAARARTKRTKRTKSLVV